MSHLNYYFSSKRKIFNWLSSSTLLEFGDVVFSVSSYGLVRELPNVICTSPVNALLRYSQSLSKNCISFKTGWSSFPASWPQREEGFYFLKRFDDSHLMNPVSLWQGNSVVTLVCRCGHLPSCSKFTSHPVILAGMPGLLYWCWNLCTGLLFFSVGSEAFSNMLSSDALDFCSEQPCWRASAFIILAIFPHERILSLLPCSWTSMFFFSENSHFIRRSRKENVMSVSLPWKEEMMWTL